MPSEIADTEDTSTVTGQRNRLWHKLSPGFAASIGFHVVALVLFVLALGYAAIPNEIALVIPVSIVRLADETTSPEQPRQAVVPRQRVRAGGLARGKARRPLTSVRASGA